MCGTNYKFKYYQLKEKISIRYPRKSRGGGPAGEA